MKSILLVVTLIACVSAQSNSDCRPFEFNPYGRTPPDHGNFGTCAITIPHAGDCAYQCDSDPLHSWTLVGAPYHCNDQVVTGGEQQCIFNDYVQGAQNCTVTPWSPNADTDCNTMCGGGTQTYGRRVITYGELGGEPCPALSITVPCHREWCRDNIVSEGYYHWGPFCAGQAQRTVGYYIHTSQDIDLYVFDEPDFNRYTWDSALSTPQNAYYSPVNAYLTTNFEADSFVVPPGKCYYLVLDNTGVGPTKGNNGEYENVYFEFAIRGVTPADGFSDFSYQLGLYQPAAAVRSSSVSFFGVFLTAIILLILKLE